MNVVLLLLLPALLGGTREPPSVPAPTSSTSPTTPEAGGEKALRPDDKTLVASFDVVQGDGKDRVSLYRDGTLALVRTYAGVRTLKKKVLPEVEVDFVRRVCSEALALDVGEYRVDVLGRGEPRRFRIEVGRADDLPRVFAFDELARIPLALGRARSALEGLLNRFDETVLPSDDPWDPAGLRTGDVLIHRVDGKRYRVVRDDLFVRSLEMVEVERALQRLVVLREDVPRLFLEPETAPEGGTRR